ncbi:Nif3-like dinuclear metal center hexameric protein [Patescibacteria group bacterium]|nr:Nif3-like dinuclear metal center hexameric protein [Patescibacteria group bacterium]MBU1663558.1 Nif3-like dinuclear metal center hexameric protein [Patescibacteria group bacterium]MBU1934204.1 Nif3-like dinuclear metal center hexameric protein [Patescibacteria group bacterium]MBU2007582.1 Nif3-like dinuclear metal center hexameric protein [Patescibacteria group bacterium]MBU2233794.1 Nif3-like dinuclear metal center hexameric protein [Patescibacteria group bacterium]
MTTQQIYELAIQMGINADLRGKEKVKKYLARAKKNYEELSAKAKEEFDKEKLINPYSDTRILIDLKKKNIKKIMIGVDMEGAELLLAEKLGVDLVIAHHPCGKALADLHSVMDLQAEVLADYGVPINIAESVIKLRIAEVSRGISPRNHNRAVDMAKILGLDFMCVHTPADNLGANFLVKKIKKDNPETVGEVIEMLKEIPEFKAAVQYNAGPKIFVGSPEASCGKIAITEFTGGTSGSKEMYEKIAQAGIGTVIGMHMGEEHRKEAEKYHINAVVAGHIASDSLGLNLFLDELEIKNLEIIPLSGLIRVKRKK